MPDSRDSQQRILVCQNRTCRKQGAAKVLAAFRAQSVAGEVVESSCLGQCGNGPMVLVQPEGVWYRGMRADEVPMVAKRHT